MINKEDYDKKTCILILNLLVFLVIVPYFKLKEIELKKIGDNKKLLLNKEEEILLIMKTWRLFKENMEMLMRCQTLLFPINDKILLNINND